MPKLGINVKFNFASNCVTTEIPYFIFRLELKAAKRARLGGVTVGLGPRRALGLEDRIKAELDR